VAAETDQTAPLVPTPLAKPAPVQPVPEDASSVPEGADHGFPGAARPEEDKKYGRIPNDRIQPPRKPTSASTPPGSVAPSS